MVKCAILRKKEGISDCISDLIINYFNFSIKQWSFINEFYDYVDFYCVSEIYNNPKISVISINELLEMDRTVTSIFIKK